MKKSIGIIIPSLKKYGGAERYMIELCRYIQNDFDITIYAPDISVPFLEEHGINENVKKIKLKDPFSLTEKYQFVLNTIVIAKYWKQEIKDHDLYLCNTFPCHLIDKHPMLWFPHEPMRAIYDLKYEGRVERRGKEIAKSLHVYPKVKYDSLKDYDFEAIADTIKSIDDSVKPLMTVANSKYCSDYIFEALKIKCDGYIYPGCDVNPFTKIKKDKNLFITVSQLWSHKRVHLLLESIKLTDETELIIVGSGPEKENLKNTVKKLDLENRVFFLENLKNSEIQILLARSSGFLFAPIREPFGIVVLEAMSAGCPIIAVNEGGFTEVLNSKNSFLCNPFPHEFAEKIKLLQNDEKLIQKMSAESLKLSKNYSWKKSAIKLKQKISNILENTKTKEIKHYYKNNYQLVGIQYYGWYEEGYGNKHWNDNNDTAIKITPSLGYYGSTKGEIIKRHLRMIESAGIDYLIINLHVDFQGINHTELMTIEHVSNIIKQTNSKLKFTIQIVPSQNLNEVSKTYKLIKKYFFNQNAYLKIDQKPILYWFWTSEFDNNLSFFNSDFIKDSKKNNLNFAQSLRIPFKIEEEMQFTKNLFDSFYFFSPLEVSDYKNLEDVWYKATDLASNFKYFSYNVSPGYDDTHVNQTFREKNLLRKVSRNNGETYKKTFNFIKKLKRKPNFINISTFNEFHEESNIEPDNKYGDKYLKLTKTLILDLKKDK